MRVPQQSWGITQKNLLVAMWLKDAKITQKEQ